MTHIKALTVTLLFLLLSANAFAENSKFEFPSSIKGLGTFTLPEGWVVYEENELEKKAENELFDAFWKIEAEYKEDYVSDDPKGYLKTILGNFKSNLISMKASDITETLVDGKVGYDVEVTGGLKTGVKYVYHLTALEAEDKFIMLMTWAAPSKYRKHKDQMISISQSVTWKK